MLGSEPGLRWSRLWWGVACATRCSNFMCCITQSNEWLVDISVPSRLWLMFTGIFIQHCTYRLPIPPPSFIGTLGSQLPFAMFLLPFHTCVQVSKIQELYEHFVSKTGRGWGPQDGTGCNLLNYLWMCTYVYHEHPWATCAWRPILRKPYYWRESVGIPHLKNTLIIDHRGDMT